MKTNYAVFVATAAILAFGVKAAPADSQTCYTVHSGYFAVHPNYGQNKGVTLNSNNQVVYGDPGTPIQVDFQACPTLLGNWPNEDIYIGRILVGTDCLKIDNPDSATEPYFASVGACSSDTTPTAGETWSYGTSDDRGVVYWRGDLDGYGHVGYIPVDNAGTPKVTTDTHLLEVGCDHECINFSIVTTLD
ncbi:hypothetical protein FRC00_011217 [Tulasnella sp. 408]|nr:hypothetical protein FRC00_011217 [Tulasnella sp. 408]